MVTLTSGSEDNRVTRGGANFLVKFFTNSESPTISSMNFMRHLTAERTTAALAWARRGVMRSQMLDEGKDEGEVSQAQLVLTNTLCKNMPIMHHQALKTLALYWTLQKLKN